ncbi:MAG: tetratricopeptide repeat protein [Desulfobacteraceae bacterium]|nr:tetratricopeptide repeat protein [Desulfobacteraceae bacterium]
MSIWGLSIMTWENPKRQFHPNITALNIKPELAEACGYLVSQLKGTFQWQKLSQYSQQLERMTLSALNNGIRPAETPFDILSRQPDPKLNFEVARAWSSQISKMMESVKWQVLSVKEKDITPNTSHLTHKNKIKIGYLSCDFRNHPVAHLIIGLFKHHRREKFEVFAYSYGGPDPTDWQQKIVQSCDHFTDIHAMTHVQAAQKIHQDGIDILLDLTGHTKNNRLPVCALGSAPIQISYLGFPGTSGAEFFDYILTDKIVSPKAHEAFYSEKFIYLPDCYMVYDNAQAISDKLWTRKDAGLSESGIVFCSFNQPYKIEPKIFDAWMRILAQIPDSVLWLSEQEESSHARLRHGAEQRGVSKHRLIFAPKAYIKEDYLARLALADIALDTVIYNGHATTADALWAGVPVITVQGTHFASRAASSILNATGLSELICQSLQDYESLAVRLAANPDALLRIRQKLSKYRLTSLMFDTRNMVGNIEQAYQTVWQLHTSGQSPRIIEFSRLDLTQALTEACAHHQAGRLSQAKAIYERVLQEYPNHADTLHLYGLLAHQEKDHERGIALIRKAIAISPKTAVYQSNLGIILYELEQYDAAVFHYQKAIELEPTQPGAYYNLGLVLKMQGRWEEAFSVFQKAAEIDTNYADAYNGMGMIRQNQDQAAEAMDYFQKAVQLNPNLADAYYNMANTLTTDHQKAIACYRKVLEIQPDHRRAIANLYHRLVYTCSWDDLQSLSSKVDEILELSLKTGEKTAEQPLMSVIWNADPARNLAVANHGQTICWVKSKQFPDFHSNCPNIHAVLSTQHSALPNFASVICPATSAIIR